VIVITRNGKTTVLTGWREWLARAGVFLAAILLLALVAFVMLGLAVTIGAIAMIVIPAALIVALLGSLFARH
jgi:Na+/melibiose symporter-like transporter